MPWDEAAYWARGLEELDASVVTFLTSYFLTPLLAAGVVYALHSKLERATSSLLVLDAVGVSLFCVSGTMRAFSYGQAPLLAAVLGVVTAFGSCHFATACG